MEKEKESGLGEEKRRKERIWGKIRTGSYKLTGYCNGKFSQLTILAFHKLLIFVTWSVSQYILILEYLLVSY